MTRIVGQHHQNRDKPTARKVPSSSQKGHVADQELVPQPDQSLVNIGEDPPACRRTGLLKWRPDLE